MSAGSAIRIGSDKAKLESEICNFLGDDTEANDCPIQILGIDSKGRFWYVDANGRIVSLTPAQHGNQANIDALFGGERGIAWLMAIEPFVKRGERGVKMGYYVDRVRQWLFTLAGDEPPFSPDRHIRRKGTWLDDKGRLVVHAGDKVFVNGIPGPAGRRLNKQYEGAGLYVYPLDTPDPYPDYDAPAPASDFHYLAGVLGRWNYEIGPVASRIVLGWIVNAMICGVVSWRPHMLLTGAPGTGKSTLLELILAIFDPDGIVSSDDATEAYIRQVLNGARKAILLDELENDADDWRVRSMIKLARNSSKAREGGGTGRGSADGVATSWSIVSAFLFSSVNPIPLTPQDRSRITPIRLRPVPADAGEVARLEAAIEDLRARGPALRGRVCDPAFLERYRMNLRIVQDALAAQKCSPRLCDQMGALMAGTEAALSDTVIERDSADALVDELAGAGMIDEAAATDTADDCLARLLSWRAKVYSDRPGHVEMTLGELIGLGYRNEATAYTRALRTYGLAWHTDDDQNHFLCVAESASELERIFAGTRFQGGGWTEALRRLDRAHRFRKSVWLASVSQRATWLEASLVVETEQMESRDQDAAAAAAAEARRNQGADRAEGME